MKKVNTVSLKKFLLISFLIVVVASFVYVISAFTSYHCFWRKYFNIYCAGCGATRMISMIFKLKFYAAFRYNPLFFILLVLLIIYFFYYFISIILKRSVLVPKFSFIIFLMFVILIYMILRNTAFFKFLKPT